MNFSTAPYRAVRFGARDTTLERRADGTLILRSPHAMGEFDRCVSDWLLKWARERADQPFLAKRDANNQWVKLTFRQTLEIVRALAQALLGRKLSPERPLVILSGNDLEHALLGLAAMHAGIPYAPISVPYSLVSKDFEKLRHIIALLNPGLVFAADGQAFAAAIAATVPLETELVVTANPPPGRAATLYAQLAATTPTAAVDAAYAAVTPDTIAKFLFTSGSTGNPKGVINTQRMLTSNQRQIAHALPFLDDAPPVFLDWPPWNHTFGGNHDFYCVLYHGGTLYLDDGKPLPGQIEKTVANLKEIAPTMYLNVPKGYEALLPFFEADQQLRENFFGKVKLLFYAGAGLSQHVWDELDRLSVETCGERIPMITSLGATETAPAVLFANWVMQSAGNVGLPIPGQELKLVPTGATGDAKLELRVRGPNITPGYWKNPALTAAAFDEEGFYKMGDALKFFDPADPAKGLMFDGRVAEDFKLATGTWASVGALRAGLIAAGAPHVQDVVIAGHDRDDVCALIFPAPDACRRLAATAPGVNVGNVCGAAGAGSGNLGGSDAASALPLPQLLAHPAVRAAFQATLDQLARASTGSASFIARALLMEQLPSLDAGEATDKGSLSQRMILKHRAALVDELYLASPTARTLITRRK